MSRPSKKDIKAAVDKLKDKPSESAHFDEKVGKPAPAKNSMRIRKKGI